MSRRRWLAAMAMAVTATGLLAGHGRAHVAYVTDSADSQSPVVFLVAVLSDPVNVGLIVGGGILVVGAVVGYLWYRPFAADVRVFRETVADYQDLLPWLLRLSFGLPLVGAGFAGYLFAPTVPPFLPGIAAPSRLVQIGLGFLLLFGLATRAAALIALAVYLVVAATDPRAWLAAEYVPGLLAVTLLGSGRPSADHVLAELATAEGTVYSDIDPVHRLAVWTDRALDPYRPATPTVIRVGLGITFVILGLVEKLLAPGQALAVVEKYELTQLLPLEPGMWVVGAAFAEIGLGLALIAGLFTRTSALVALAVFVLTLFGIPDDPVLAHVSLFGLASVLIVTGSGPFALDRMIGQPDPAIDPTTAQRRKDATID